MTRPIDRKPKTPLEATALLVECLSEAEDSSGALHRFGALAGAWLSCPLVLLQVRGMNGSGRFFACGVSVPIQAIGEGDLRRGKAADALASGRLVVSNRLKEHPAFSEDTVLVGLGMRAGIRGLIRTGGVELGRFGFFAESPGHFTAPRRRLAEWLMPALTLLFRYVAQAEAVGTAAAAGSQSDWTVVPRDLLTGLTICREALDRAVTSIGSLVCLVGEGDPLTILVDRAGAPLAGVPGDGPPELWRAWLEELPAEGCLEQGVWAAPVHLDGRPVGAVAVGAAGAEAVPARLRARTKDVRAHLAGMAAHLDGIRRTEALGRFQVATLAAGLADELENMATELAFQVELLQDSSDQMTGGRSRQEAMLRLVQKGAHLAERLEGLAQGPPPAPADGRITLRDLVDGAAAGLRAYPGGRSLQVDAALGRFEGAPVPAGLRQALHYLLLLLAEHRTGGAQVLIRAHPDPRRPGFLTLWIGERGEEAGLWDSSLQSSLNTVRHLAQTSGGNLSHTVLEPGTQVLTLQVPILTA